MRSLQTNALRPDPRIIYQIHAEYAAGLSTAEIAAEHGLPPLVVAGFLKATSQVCGLATPYGLARHELPSDAPVQIYWLGYIAAAGRVLGQHAYSTLILAIHPADEPHIETLLHDLVIGHAAVELADSNLDGRQAYVRDRHLVEVLRQWGIAGTAAESVVPVEFIPPTCLPDFVRGYLEGSRLRPPFGGSGARTPSPRGLRSLAFVGPPVFLEHLDRLLQSACGVGPGSIDTSGPGERSRLDYPLREGMRILAWAYDRPTRTGPRAVRFVGRFGRAAKITLPPPSAQRPSPAQPTGPPGPARRG